jgi:hypothetical protein
MLNSCASLRSEAESRLLPGNVLMDVLLVLRFEIIGGSRKILVAYPLVTSPKLTPILKSRDVLLVEFVIIL